MCACLICFSFGREWACPGGRGRGSIPTQLYNLICLKFAAVSKWVWVVLLLLQSKSKILLYS